MSMPIEAVVAEREEYERRIADLEAEVGTLLAYIDALEQLA